MTPDQFNIMAALWLSVSFLAGMMAYAMWTDFLNWLGATNETKENADERSSSR